jgi:hypothetical protein
VTVEDKPFVGWTFSFPVAVEIVTFYFIIAMRTVLFHLLSDLAIA